MPHLTAAARASVAAALCLGGLHAVAQPRAPATDRLIVRLADWAETDRAQPMRADRARSLSITARSRLEPYRRMSGGAHVVHLTHDMPVAEVEAMAVRARSAERGSWTPPRPSPAPRRCRRA